jgi:hypothetical protein
MCDLPMEPVLEALLVSTTEPLSALHFWVFGTCWNPVQHGVALFRL